MLPDYLLRKQSGELEIVTGDEPFTVTPAAGPGEYTVSRVDNSATVTVTGTDLSIPVLSGVGSSVSGSTAFLSWTTNEGEGTAYWVCTNSATQPSANQIIAGQDHTGAPGDAAGNQPVTVAGVQPDQTIENVPAGAYHFHLFQRDAANNDSATASTPFTIAGVDTTAPTLSAVTAALSGSTATLRWSTNEGNGTAYWVCTTSATPPSVAQIIAGETETGSAAVSSGIQAVSANGAQTDQVVTGLATGPTYFFHLLHRDANSNTSSISSTTGVFVSSASATINIVRRSSLRVAPEAPVFEIINLVGFDTPGPAEGAVYDPQFHDLYYLWDFDDPGTFSAPENLVAGHENSNVAYGPTVSHTFRQPGNYAVSCLIVEPSSGKTVTVTLNFAVGNPDNMFVGANTLYVASDGNFTNKPANAAEYTSFQAAFDAARGQQVTPKRIMLKRGGIYTVAGTSLGNGLPIPSMHIVAESGGGAKPVVNLGPDAYGTHTWFWADTSTTGNGSDKDFILQGVVWNGPWDVVTETGISQDGFMFLDNPPQHALFDQCDFSGWQLTLASSGNNVNISQLMMVANDCSVTNWRNYAFYGCWGIAVATGNRFSQAVNALGGGPAFSTHIEGGPIRMPLPQRAIIHSNDLFASNCGWISNIPGIWTQQPCMRWNTTPQRGAILNAQCNAMEGGFNVVNIQAESGQNGEPVNALLEKNLIVGSHHTVRFVEVQFGGVTIRNNTMINPDVPRTFDHEEALSLVRFGSDAENRDAPISFYSNTVVNLVSDSNLAFFYRNWNVVNNPGGFTNVVEVNNIEYQPNAGVLINAGEQLDDTVLWPARYIGYQDYQNAFDASRATPDSAATYAPLSGSPALGDALSGPVAYDDLYGNPRPLLPSRGAFELPA